MSLDLAALAQRLAHIRANIAKASCGRDVTLVAASKFQPLQALLALYALGVRDFGENYAQPLAERAQAMAALGLSPRWHLIGGLQRNKAKRVAPWVDVVHSIDSEGLAEALSVAWQRAARATPIDVMLQVRLGPDPVGPRRGIAPDAVASLATHLRGLPGLRLSGLMGLPTQRQDRQHAFADLAALSHRLAGPTGPLRDARSLSMGMSEDFSLAIAEGATVVRIGSALFGARPKPA